MIGGIVMGMPVPAGLRQEVTAAHRNRIAPHHGPDPLAFDHKAECVLGVSMLRRILPRHQVLDGRPQRRAHEGPTAQGGIRQGDCAPLAATSDGDDLAGALGERQKITPAPQVRAGLRLGMLGHESTDLGPQRNEHLLLESAVELLELRGHGRLPGCIDGGQANGRLVYGHGISVSLFRSQE